jgi:hypothetical protein
MSFEEIPGQSGVLASRYVVRNLSGKEKIIHDMIEAHRRETRRPNP